MKRYALILIVSIMVLGFPLASFRGADAASGSETADAPATQEDAKEAAREKRAELRAFYTAPPVIPHELVPGRSDNCQFCHAEVREVMGSTTVKTPHPEKSNCLQCHLAAQSPLGDPVTTVKNSFEGLKEPREGSRISIVSPPTMPHRYFMRENCTSCHVMNSPYAHLQTPHGERSQCRQCHVADGDVEFKVSIRTE